MRSVRRPVVRVYSCIGGAPGAHRPAYPDAHRYASTGPFALAHSHSSRPYADAYVDTYTDIDPNAHTDSCVDAHTDIHSHVHTDSIPHTNIHSHAHTDSIPHSDSCSYADPNIHANANANADEHAYAHSNPDRYPHSDGYSRDPSRLRR